MIYKDKKKCTACEACLNACPTSAISFKTDEYGNDYPIIDEDKCIKCDLCKKVCLTRGLPEYHKPLGVKVVCLKDEENLKKSSSGALFFGLAQSVINKGGVVFGASYTDALDGIGVFHKAVEKQNDLYLLQGSKYTRSYIELGYKEVEKYLNAGKIVFFTGTPCQVAGLYNYLGGDNPLLVTADVICHGVPEQRLFKKYIRFLEEKYKGTIISLSFRDKKYGWGLIGDVYLRKDNGKIVRKKLSPNYSSYYSLFIDGSIYRQNCYSCEFAKGERVSDITMGDYWGIESEHPEVLVDNGGNINSFKGVSCAIINTQKGEKVFEATEDYFITYDSSFERIQRNNTQLKSPTNMTEDYHIYSKLINDDYLKIDNHYWQENSRLKVRVIAVRRKVGRFVPKRIKQLINK